MRHARLSWIELGGCLLLASLGYLLWFQFSTGREMDIKAAMLAFQAENQAKNRAVAVNIEASFRQMYQGIRTIARLPTVRALSSESHSLQEDARVSAQEIYNNLAENLSVSELYIVPANFDPDRVDADRATPEVPLMTFDEFIVGKNADQNSARLASSVKSRVEEVEIFEYRAMKIQLDYLNRKYGNDNVISNLNYPAIASREVITCDNTHYSPTAPDDDNRKGLVYSVPFFGFDGKLRGIVTAVVLSDVLTEILPNDGYALSNDRLGFYRGSRDGQLWRQVSPRTEAGLDNVAYGSSTPLDFPDVGGGWSLWSVVPTAVFLKSPAVQSINERFRTEVIILILGSVALAAALRWLAYRGSTVERHNRELALRIEERTAELANAKKVAEEASSAKSRFLARVSHEIRTPMHAIVGAAELLRASQPDRRAQAKLEIIDHASQTLLDIVNQVLDLSAIEHGKLNVNSVEFEPSTLLLETCDMMRAVADRKGLTIAVECASNTPARYRSDPARIRQILVNLIANALKHTPAGGVTVRVSSEISGILAFDVVDTGSGIAEDDREHIFQEFYRGANSDGSGLGLAISRQLVERLGGTIQVSEAHPHGAHFRFTITIEPAAAIPIAREEPSLPEPKRKLSTATGPAIRILLAEDNERVRGLLEETLRQFGCLVQVASDGEGAVAAVRHTSFDAILMDCSMPKLDGIRATSRIREIEAASAPDCRRARIIALTASAYASDREACLRAGMDDFLSKPFKREELFRVLGIAGEATGNASAVLAPVAE
ncbi:ATP-binding protein [Mesorhizobium sp. B2-4-17]|uniref:ATP-binding protein n=1 Tax=Mesorhizobium sp. B2-4-17 TaxID=2589932 RepID=UPI00112A48BE|nr:ATP-binding protein [Mesorhizobium sp. B2-4-17]TPK79055.1 response regulator [Mesorhizobium sp. B2-4-17]